MSTRTRLSPAARREQLLDLGVRLLATRGMDDVSIDLLADQAGVSRGLLYHYFASKQEFHRAVVERWAAELVEATAPVESPDPIERLVGSVHAYVDFVASHHAPYLSLLRAVHAGDPALRRLYDEARGRMLDRMFDESGPNAAGELGFEDTPAVRLLVHGWFAMVEAVTVAWVEDDRSLGKDQLVGMLVGALPGAMAVTS